jgi:hypothetical protein
MNPSTSVGVTSWHVSGAPRGRKTTWVIESGGDPLPSPTSRTAKIPGRPIAVVSVWRVMIPLMMARLAKTLQAIDVDLKHLLDKAVVDLRGALSAAIRGVTRREGKRPQRSGDDGIPRSVAIALGAEPAEGIPAWS